MLGQLGVAVAAAASSHPWVLVLLERWLPLGIGWTLVPPWLLVGAWVAALVVGGSRGRIPTSVWRVARVGIPCLGVSSLHALVAVVLTPLVTLIPCRSLGGLALRQVTPVL